MADMLPFGCAAFVTGLLTCGMLLKLVRLALLRDSAKRPLQVAPEEATITEKEFQDMQIPREPHLELVHVDATGGPTRPGTMDFSNPREPYHFENEQCWGSYLFFHKPTSGSGVQGSGGLDYNEYFSGRKRLWEFRIQFHFKKAPPSDEQFFFGIELDKYVKTSAAAKRTLAVVTAAMRRAVGGLYSSVGDDPAQVTGDVELPCHVMPMWAFDQFIETPAGEAPPSLTDARFPEMGKRRHGRVREYVQEMNALTSSYTVGPTYTYAFWGVSQYLDTLSWQLRGIPLVPPIGYEHLIGKPPLYCVCYSLRPGTEETRHLQRRKNYYIHAAVWSSSRRPEAARFRALTAAGARLRRMTTALRRSLSGRALGVARGGGLRHHIDRILGDSLACCTARPSRARSEAPAPWRASS